MPKVTFNRKTASVVHFRDRKAITLEPGTHEVSPEDFKALRARGGIVRQWEQEGLLVFLADGTKPKPAPARAAAPPPDPDDEDSPEDEPEDLDDEDLLPTWDKRSRLEDLQEAAEARGLDTEGRTRTELLEELEAADADLEDGEDT